MEPKWQESKRISAQCMQSPGGNSIKKHQSQPVMNSYALVGMCSVYNNHGIEGIGGRNTSIACARETAGSSSLLVQVEVWFYQQVGR